MKNLVQTIGGDESLKYRVMGSIFFEPSTRTSCSFQAAMLRLGGKVISVSEVTRVYSLSDRQLIVCSLIQVPRKGKFWKIRLPRCLAIVMFLFFAIQ
jgi:hypothetical protein